MDQAAKRNYFEELASVWDQLPRPHDSAVRLRGFLEEALPPSPLRVLDVGCGTGILLEGLLELCPRETRIVELDFAWNMLAVNASLYRDPRVFRVCADARALPFPPGLFDAVLCFNVLPHLGETSRALEVLLAMLAPGGALAVGHWMSSEELNAFHAGLDGPVSQDRLPAVNELAAEIGRAGIEVVRAEEEPGWYFLLATKASGGA
jgi:ubiquinone/menaquinone biosynthesis C-methylase UbiE